MTVDGVVMCAHPLVAFMANGQAVCRYCTATWCWYRPRKVENPPIGGLTASPGG